MRSGQRGGAADALGASCKVIQPQLGGLGLTLIVDEADSELVERRSSPNRARAIDATLALTHDAGLQHSVDVKFDGVGAAVEQPLPAGPTPLWDWLLRPV